ncbi:helicase-exonuclease AddAB subunit AddA [Camelliibacillus cellulosilyticus]|uniref:ATP-dependent helicase/nuclease subunit A n=1 Tax=Camelliibacillus cellulosilyticus TaxID=2174486 RepID=A0ABV9GSE6_9BACL
MSEIQLKPANSRWTDDQWRAITETGSDILVAAAAGSGKTAVLVERIIRKITDPDHPIDVDRLLIVTFTNAAAAEMRSRIGQALEKELSKKPGDLRLRHQLALLNKAQITTLHAFCLSVIRRYYYRLDIDPAFRVMDDTEAELLREEVLETLFEAYYGADDQERFYELVDRYSNDRSDTELIEIIQKLDVFSRSHPWPEAWLDGIIAAYQVKADISIDDLPWTPDLKQAIRYQCQGLLRRIEEAEKIAGDPGGPYPYLENFRQDRALLEKILEATHGPWETLAAAFDHLTFSKLKPCRGDDIDTGLKDRAKGLRDNMKEKLSQLKEELFARPVDSYLEDLQEMAPYVALLVRLVKDFGKRYAQLKHEKAVVDFSDLEHLCLQILRDPASKPGDERPSDVARAYRAQFDEILVDEYQDTNFLQETILRHISRGGNVFMVGDVKQSIYRFRLAEPGLFQEKYKTFKRSDAIDDHEPGVRIDLSQNFRSRKEILDGTNYIFNQIMDETVGEIDYDERAALKLGATYYPEAERRTELHLIGRLDEAGESDEETAEYQTAELEAHYIADNIKKLIDDGYDIYDTETGQNRPIRYRDIVVLLRSASTWSPALLDVFKERGIPGYAELSKGYFEAIEVSVMMALLKTIDNPYQDIPLASVLRSPIVGLSGGELARIRVYERYGPYYDAIKGYTEAFQDDLAGKLKTFLAHLEDWRKRARRGALADLIWQIYRETGYYDYVVGLAGGEQRRANLRALYDRARQYETTSFRGLFRFLRFIERLQDNGKDLGEARALSEQEDVVRVMTIHKSKGLEFPVVFVAGLNKKFNLKDTTEKTLLHKTLGFGTKNINPIKRYTIPTLPYAAIKRKVLAESLAEEMRILYVALTRAREKLFLIGTVKDIQKTVQNWVGEVAGADGMLPTFERSEARSYLDWVGPAVMGHHDAAIFHDMVGFVPENASVRTHPSRWDAVICRAQDIVIHEPAPMEQRDKEDRLRQFLPVDGSGYFSNAVHRQMSWQYPHHGATLTMAKQTVSEIKRQQERFNEGFGDRLIRQFRRPISDRPRFLSGRELKANERGTIMHKMMQHVRFQPQMTLAYLEAERDRLVADEWMTSEEAEALNLEAVHRLFQLPVGKRLLTATRVTRELPFSLGLSATEVYDNWDGSDEKVLVQGVIDCLYEEAGGLSLIDYKTDRVTGRFENDEDAKRVLIARYQKQIDLYRLAIERIWKRELREAGLYFFDGGHYYRVD